MTTAQKQPGDIIFNSMLAQHWHRGCVNSRRWCQPRLKPLGRQRHLCWQYGVGPSSNLGCVWEQHQQYWLPLIRFIDRVISVNSIALARLDHIHDKRFLWKRGFVERTKETRDARWSKMYRRPSKSGKTMMNQPCSRDSKVCKDTKDRFSETTVFETFIFSDRSPNYVKLAGFSETFSERLCGYKQDGDNSWQALEAEGMVLHRASTNRIITVWPGVFRFLPEASWKFMFSPSFLRTRANPDCIDPKGEVTIRSFFMYLRAPGSCNSVSTSPYKAILSACGGLSIV